MGLKEYIIEAIEGSGKFNKATSTFAELKQKAKHLNVCKFKDDDGENISLTEDKPMPESLLFLGGTGLGKTHLSLSIVKEIINSHNENINVVSTEEVGTEFIFTLSKSKGITEN